MYDWANSAFATSIMAAILPIFFRNIAAGHLTENHLATSFWGYTSAVAMLCTAVLSLTLGPISDYASSKKRFLSTFTLIGITATAMLTWTGYGDWIWVALFFVVGSIGFSGSEVFYNSLLPHIAPKGLIHRISSMGYLMGYLGGGILLLVHVAAIMWLPKTTLPNGETAPLAAMRFSFFSVALWWAFFSIPLFRHVPEPPGQNGINGHNPFHIAKKRLTTTFKEIRQYKQLFIFLLAFWLYNDGISTFIKLCAAYGDEIGIEIMDLVGALVLVQFIAIPATFGFGRLAEKIGAKKSILIGLTVYFFVTFGAYKMTSALHFWILAGIVGLVQGGTQALSRSLFASMIPKQKSAEFFSFYNISGKFAGIFGPAIFGLVSQLARSSRAGALTLLFFFGTGGILLWFVKTDPVTSKKDSTQPLEFPPGK